MTHQSVSKNRSLIRYLALSLGLSVATASAQTLTWDSDTGANGNWSTADVNWDTDANGTADSFWVPNANAVFSEAAETVTVTTNNNFNDITFSITGYTIAGGAGNLDIDSTDNASSITVTNAADTAAINEVIRNNGGGVTAGALTKLGAGTVTLGAANTYSGGLTVSAGTLRLGNNAAAGTAAVSIASGATVNNSAVLNGLANTFTGSGAFTTAVGAGQVVLTGNWTGFSGTVSTVTNADMVFTPAASFVGGIFQGTSANAAYVNGFTGANTNGMIVTNSLGAGNSGTVQLGSYASVAGSNLRNSGASTGTTVFEIGNLNTPNTTAAGTIGGGGGSIALTKVGTGALTLSGANTYTGGTTVSNGTLLANTTGGTNSATGFGAVTVSASGVLGGTGQIRPTGANGISVSGAIAPGATGIGTLTLASAGTTAPSLVTMADGSTFTFELGTGAGSIAAAAAGSTSDRLAITGASAGDFAFSALGNTVNLSGGSAGLYYKLFDTDLANATNLADSWTNLTYDETTGLVSAGLLSLGNSFFVGTAGNGGDLGDIYLQAVPEPSTFAMLLGGLGILRGFQRSRRRA